MKLKVAITTTSLGTCDKKPLQELALQGFDVILNPHGRKLKKDEVIEVCRDAAGIIAGTETLDVDTLRALTHLKVISRCGAGLDNH